MRKASPVKSPVAAGDASPQADTALGAAGLRPGLFWLGASRGRLSLAAFRR